MKLVLANEIPSALDGLWFTFPVEDSYIPKLILHYRDEIDYPSRSTINQSMGGLFSMLKPGEGVEVASKLCKIPLPYPEDVTEVINLGDMFITFPLDSNQRVLTHNYLGGPIPEHVGRVVFNMWQIHNSILSDDQLDFNRFMKISFNNAKERFRSYMSYNEPDPDLDNQLESKE